MYWEVKEDLEEISGKFEGNIVKTEEGLKEILGERETRWGEFEGILREIWGKTFQRGFKC